MIEEAIVTLLGNNADWASEIGSRVYPVQAPQTAPKPYAVYRRLTTDLNHTMAGNSGLDQPMFYIDIVARDFATVRKCADAARDALDGFDSGIVDGLRIDRIHLIDESDQTETPIAAETLSPYHIQQDYAITYRRQ